VSYEEKRTWVYLVTSAGAYLVYLAIMLGRVASTPVDRVPYVAVLLWTIGASIAASIAGRVLVEAARPSDSRQADVRDKEIYRFGEYASRWFLVAGAARRCSWRWRSGTTSGSPTSSTSGSCCGRWRARC
jgi:hypothetical protein